MIKTPLLSKCLTCLLIVGGIAPLRAADRLQLAGVFQKHMVLQREREVPVWGRAEPGASVTVRFAEQTRHAEADGEGAWQVRLSPMPASAEGRSLVVEAGGDRVACTGVLVGEVWIAAGQSNMKAGGPDRPTGFYPFYESPETDGPLPPVCLGTYGWGASLQPLADCRPWDPDDGDWRQMSVRDPDSVSLPVQFGRVLRDSLGIPVGILQVAVSGTNQGAWMAKPTLESSASESHANLYEELMASHAAKLSKQKSLGSWEGFKAAESKWLLERRGRHPANSTVLNFPTALYNTRIHPLAPFAIRGVIWHQGESGPRGPYGERLVAMVRQWRERFGQDFYFIWGTLGRTTEDPPPLVPSIDGFYRSSTNGSIRGALGTFGDDPRVAMVEFYDQGDAGTHWLLKNESGRRMGFAALDLAYGKPRNYTGPSRTSVKLEGGAALVRFAHVAEGLRYAPSIDGISGVVVKGANGPMAWGRVEVVGKDLIKVSHPEGKAVRMVAYGMNRNPHETIFDSDGLPASPFAYRAGRIASKPQGPALVRAEGLGRNLGYLSVAHVRRDGYRFQLVPARGAPEGKSVAVHALAPREWEGVEVWLDGSEVTIATTAAKEGLRLSFRAPVNGAWVTVCRPGKRRLFDQVDRY